MAVVNGVDYAISVGSFRFKNFGPVCTVTIRYKDDENSAVYYTGIIEQDWGNSSNEFGNIMVTLWENEAEQPSNVIVLPNHEGGLSIPDMQKQIRSEIMDAIGRGWEPIEIGF